MQRMRKLAPLAKIHCQVVVLLRNARKVQGLGSWDEPCREGDSSEWRQRKWPTTLQPVRELFDQSSWGLWHTSQGEARMPKLLMRESGIGRYAHSG